MKKYRGMLGPAPEPALIPATVAFASVGIGRPLGRSLLSAGTIPAVQLGSKTMIRRDEWQKFLDTLPSYRAANKKDAA